VLPANGRFVCRTGLAVMEPQDSMAAKQTLDPQRACQALSGCLDGEAAR
jgi:hypothetical protein